MSLLTKSRQNGRGYRYGYIRPSYREQGHGQSQRSGFDEVTQSK